VKLVSEEENYDQYHRSRTGPAKGEQKEEERGAKSCSDKARDRLETLAISQKPMYTIGNRQGSVSKKT
jgi:hypothetical protein